MNWEMILSKLDGTETALICVCALIFNMRKGRRSIDKTAIRILGAIAGGILLIKLLIIT